MSSALSSLPALSATQAEQLGRLTDGLDAPRLWWLSGYAAGLAGGFSAPAAPAPTQVPDVAQATTISIVYGSQTGNARRVAEQFAQRLESSGAPVRLLGADAYPLRELKDERQLYLIVSTQGEGEPPDDARALVEFIASRRAPALPDLRYAVLGLGDSSYPQFCVIGQQLDARLAELGATRLFARGDADLDIDSVANPWLELALESAQDAIRDSSKPQLPSATVTPLRPSSTTPSFDRATPFAAELLANQRITGRGSDRDIRHLEVSLQGSGLHYEPGDALGVWPSNPPQLVDAVLAALALDGEASVTHADETLSLRHWLGDKRELTRLTRPFLAAHATRVDNPALSQLLETNNSAALTTLLSEQQTIDLLLGYPGAWSAEDLVAALRPLTPRLYSIASSQKAVGDEAHLTVAHVQYAFGGQLRHGAASNFLASRQDAATLPIYIERNERFRLPPDPARDIVMIGPGTGVAPFRGFMQERAAIGASGRNWLLFGNPHFRSDFLYQLEWQRALKNGQLHRLDLAFSRDNAKKIYVQHRLREHGRDLYAWLESGAHLYVCGATRMAKDVHAALIEVVVEHGARSREDAEAYVNDLQRLGRYARDVY